MQRVGVKLLDEHPLETFMFRSTLGLLLILACAYVYLLTATTFAVVDRKEAHARTTELQTTVAQLEADYAQLAQSVDAQLAVAYALTEPIEKQFATRHVAGATGALAHNEI